MVLSMRRRLPRRFLAPGDLWRRSDRGTRGAMTFLGLLTAAVAVAAVASEVPVPIDAGDLPPVVFVGPVIGLLFALRRRDRVE